MHYLPLVEHHAAWWRFSTMLHDVLQIFTSYVRNKFTLISKKLPQKCEQLAEDFYRLTAPTPDIGVGVFA